MHINGWEGTHESIRSHQKIEMEEKQWVVSITKDLENLANASEESEQWSKRSIYRIPASVTDIKRRAYKPQIVSFGPYHHNDDNLRAMEAHKRRALLHFLKRSNKPLRTYVEALAPFAQDLKDAYDQLSTDWIRDTDKFLELMIVDACFILELLRADADEDDDAVVAHAHRPPAPNDQATPHRDDRRQRVVKDYADKDPIFSHHGMLYIVPYLKRDMLMLENQLPMLVLEKLVAVHNDNSLKDGKDLTKRILKFHQRSVPAKNLHQFKHCLHILDIYRKSLLLEEPKGKRRKSRNAGGDESHHQHHEGVDEIIRSATELNEAGIRIKRSSSRSLKDISFHGGVLKLPLIVVDDALESLYLNLIAFERFHVGAGNEVTSYIFFMDNIIDSARDVSLLHSCGIIQNALGSDKAVAKLFNSLSTDITLDPDSSLSCVHKQVSAYCQQPWHQWRANLIHNYFTNPWAILSVFAAVLLFALTILQTIYSVLSYVDPP